MPSPTHRLSIHDHDRDSAGLVYVYPVVSRRAGGVSVGINLNPNNACNWQCIYCQVPDLRRGGPPPIDLGLLEKELDGFLRDLLWGDYMQGHVPAEAQHLSDIAFSGNGEPTAAAELAAAVGVVGKVLARFPACAALPVRLITNGSLVGRRKVQTALARLDALGGEVWFKLDAGTEADYLRINGTHMQLASVKERLLTCIAHCRTWVQTCVFAIDGQPTLTAHSHAYFELLEAVAGKGNLCGVHLYGLARESQQAEANRLSPLSAESLQSLAAEIEKRGLTVRLSP